MKTPSVWQVGSILIIGVLAIATTAIFIRLATDTAGIKGVGFSLFLAASRLIIAAVILLPTWNSLKQQKIPINAYYYAIAAGLTLALHFAAWITSLSYTSIAASTVLVTTNPIWISILSWIWFKEKITKTTILGILIAFLGGVLVAFGDNTASSNYSNPLLGNFLALIGAVIVSFYFLLGREAQRKGLSTKHYITVAYSAAAIVLFPLPFLFGTSYTGYPNEVYLYVFLMAIFSQLIGHTSFNWAIRWISPILVTLAILFEPIGASFFGYLIFGEIPSNIVLLGGLVLLVGVAIAVIGTKHQP
ncbi:EamA family transporter [Aphanothece hegewaldii CCALA 016]|uniref:EamA family transporter n=1 Tax=Aphanothece hegewaldii CCALA 016 TaxID=2107694 RepID=A0A2T1LUY9_9CHRO|nr:DMT family transporter [Aphanothece hegewaldii]PSF35444.1 EamA family transporter [Aphanothece hegewaldii CCALA 016]